MSRALPLALPHIRTAAEHFHQMALGTALFLIECWPAAQRNDLFEQLPFLRSYQQEAASLAKSNIIPTAADWSDAMAASTRKQRDLPYHRLEASAFPAPAPALLTVLALVEEDPNFGFLIEAEGGFPTLGGLLAFWRQDGRGDSATRLRDLLLDLIAAGLVEATNPDAPRNEWRLRLPGPVLDVLTGSSPRIEGATFTSNTDLPRPAEWRAPSPQTTGPAEIAALLAANPARLIVARGPGHNGRRLLLAASARAAGMNVMQVPAAMLIDPDQWQRLGAAAHLANAMILAELIPAPGETIALPPHRLFKGALGIVMTRTGGVRPPAELAMITLDISLPDAKARARQWKAHGLGEISADLQAMMMTMGHIARAAASALAMASMQKAKAITPEMVRAAVRGLRDARLDALATPVDPNTAPEKIYLEKDEQAEFDGLILRAQYREEMEGNRGVRALFSGASGTGKTLAARHIATKLGKDLFRIDLAATVSKYIGETEKSLDAALSAAEELDIVLLLDEGDALMARRTDVGNANDRYANMETNFLLQRLENFAGIILVTTNDAERIDQAFARRMDAVLCFRPPNEVLRLDILNQLLGPHKVEEDVLHDIACRCELTGGNLRNVALHARLLAKAEGKRKPDSAMLLNAIQREYRKTGDFAPVRVD